MKAPAWSIRRKVILLVWGLMLAGAVVASWMTYVELRRAALATARDRLAGVTHQLTDMLIGSAEQLESITADVASSPQILAYLRSPGESSASLATAVMDSVARQQGSTIAIELLSPEGGRLLVAGDSTLHLDGDDTAAFLAAIAGADSAGAIGPFRVASDTVRYAAGAKVTSGGETVGYVVQRRRVAGSEDTGRQLRDLIGPGSALFVGNARGDVWTDLVRAVPGPPIDGTPTGDTLLQYAREGGEGRLAAFERVPGTPWAVVLEFPRAPVVAGAQRVAGRLAMIMALLAALGTVVAWVLANRLMRPLADAADAAGGIARGDYARRLEVGSQDELGELAEAFNGMAERVQEAQERLEQKVLERTAELRAVNEELEAFSYSVSHDLRAPLRSIDGFCQALLEDAEDDLDDVGRGHLQRVRAASQRMAKLIDDLLDLSRVTRSDMNRQRVDLTELAHEIVRELVDDRTRQTDVVIAPALEAQGDRRLLRLVLQNLIGNAWKFTRDRTQPRIEVGAETDRGRTVFYVRDNGAGFDMAYADKLFTPFHRLHAAAEFEGTGVGLATVQRIVHRHGGRVWADAAVDRGATIRFTLDHHDAAEASRG